jgi:type VI secretion system protein ImpA
MFGPAAPITQARPDPVREVGARAALVVEPRWACGVRAGDGAPQVNTETLVEGVAPEAPCGDDLSYDPAFMELERTAQGGPQGRIVGPDVPADGPDWRVVRKQAVALLARTKDLRVAVLLAKAMLRTDGFEGLRDGTWVIRELLIRYWDTLHPQMTEEDDFSPIMRGNALRDLVDRQSVLIPLRNLPLVTLSGLGSFSLRDIALASGELTATNGTPIPEQTKIDAAFDNCPLEPLQQTAAAVHGALENLAAVESYMAEKVGAHQTVTFEDLTGVLQQMVRLLGERMARRTPPETSAPDVEGGAHIAHDTHAGGASGASDGHGGPSSAPLTNGGQNPAAAGFSQAGTGSGVFVPGEIRSRAEVIRALDALCGYYDRHEPSSPVPMLLRRAQRLVHMSFVDIMKDLAPGAMSDIEKIRGPEEPQN